MKVGEGSQAQKSQCHILEHYTKMTQEGAQ